MKNNPLKIDIEKPEKKLFRMIIPCFSQYNVYSSVAKYTTALGPIMVATSVSKLKGWDVEVIDENNFHQYSLLGPDHHPDHAIMQRLRPADVVAFYGGLSSTVERIYFLADFYKKQNCLTVAGGQHFIDDNIQEALDSGIDYLIIGEGEIAIEELLSALTQGTGVSEIFGIAYKLNNKIIVTQPREDNYSLDMLPLPDFSLLCYAKMSLYPVSWERGCCMNCEFCTVKAKVRCPSVNYALNQFTFLYEHMKATNFFIVDDLFGQNIDKTLELCRKLQEYQSIIGVNFYITVQIRLDKANNSELLTAMRNANIRVVAIGYESPIGSELEAMDKRLTANEMVSLTNIFHKAGFFVHGMFIFGYPLKEGENQAELSVKERVKIYWEFIRNARIDTIQILLPVPLPGTALTERLNKHRRIFPKNIIGWEFYDGNFPLFYPDPPLTLDDMLWATSTLMKRFYHFRYFLCICLNIFSFPSIILSLNIKKGWRRWYKSWRNNIWKSVGWGILRKWTLRFKKDRFLNKIPPRNFKH